MKSKINSFYFINDGKRIFQGDIFRDFEYKEWVVLEDKTLKIRKREIPYLIILTQDCDLNGDFYNHKDDSKNQDKFLHSILVCPAYTAEKVRAGIHLSDLDLTMEKINSSRWCTLKKNNNPRYHFLNRNNNFQIPDLVIDFKHYYTIPRDILYNQYKPHYLGTTNELFREALSQRFAFYLSRIGLPSIEIEKESTSTKTFC